MVKNCIKNILCFFIYPGIDVLLDNSRPRPVRIVHVVVVVVVPIAIRINVPLVSIVVVEVIRSRSPRQTF